MRPQCEHTKPLTGTVVVTVRANPRCVFCELKELRAALREACDHLVRWRGAARLPDCESDELEQFVDERVDELRTLAGEATE